MILQQTTTLSNGRAMPTLGLGTWFIEDGDAAKAVRDAAEIGYRHFDSAQAYGNEAGVGEGVRTCGVPREELFVTSKLGAEAKTYDEAVRAIDGSLTTSGLDHLDMMLIHSPQPWQEFGGEDRHEKGNQEAWRALEEAYQAGKLGAIGLSNFQERDIDNILEVATVAPMVNQVLAHITNVPSDLIAYSREKGMVVQGYSPMGHGELMKDEQVAAVAQRYGVSIPQLAIRFSLQLGLVVLPKTANPDHMRSNADVDFEIAEEDMGTLLGLERIEYGEASVFPVYS